MVRLSLERLFCAFVTDGDEAALDELFRRSTPSLRRLAENLGHRGADADDLVQDSMVTAVELADRFDPGDGRTFLPWVKGILARKAAHIARDRMRRSAGPLDARDLPRSGSPAPETGVCHAELRQILVAAIANLPEVYREPLRLLLLRDCEPQEVAAHLGRPRATVRVQLHRGLELLRRALPAGTGTAAVLVAQGRLCADRVPMGVAAGKEFVVLRRLRQLLAGSALALVVVGGIYLALRSETSVAATTAEPTAVTQVRRMPAAVGSPAANRRAVLAAAREVQPTGLEVLVRDTGGRPVAHVGVRLEPSAGLDPVLYRRRARTDAEGVARLPHPGAGGWRLSCDRGARTDLRLDAGRGRRVELSVRGSLRVEGLVVDADGCPLPEAEVWVGDSADARGSGLDVTRSDGDGHFVLCNIAPGTPIAVRHRDWARGPVHYAPRSRMAGPLRFAMKRRGRSISGRVIDGAGRPVADAVVHVGACLDAAPFVFADGAAPDRPPAYEVRTDDAGCFATSALAAGRFPVIIRAAGYRPALHYVVVDADTERREARTALPLEQEFELERGPVVRVEVVDESGQPVSGAHVAFRGEGLHGHVDICSDDRGQARFTAVPAGAGQVAVRAPGRRPWLGPIRLGSTEHRDLRICLARCDRQPGRILLPDDTPAAAYEIRCRRSMGDGLEPALTFAQADAQGRFFLDISESAERLRLWVRGPGEPLWLAVEDRVTWRGREMCLHLDAGHRATSWLDGRLVDRAGQSISNQRLFLRRGSGVAWEVGRTDSGGRFRVGPVPAGDYELFGETTHPERPSLILGKVRVGPAQTVHLERRVPISGVVRWELLHAEARMPSELVLTLVSVPGGGFAKARRVAIRRDAKGRQALVPGHYRLFAMGSDFRWIDGRPFTIRAGQTTALQISLHRASRRQLVLRGLPRLRGSTKAVLMRVPDGVREGEFRVWLDRPRPLAVFLGPGRYELRIDDPRLGRWRGGFELHGVGGGARTTPVDLTRR